MGHISKLHRVPSVNEQTIFEIRQINLSQSVLMYDISLCTISQNILPNDTLKSGGDEIGNFKKWWGHVNSVPKVNDTCFAAKTYKF